MILLKKYYIVIINILFWLLILPLLSVISLVNIEDIYQFNFNNIYVISYFAYLFISIFWLILFRKININNNILKDEIFYTLKSILFLSIFIIPTFFINHFFILEHIWESNLYLRSYWKIAFLFFALALLVSPILKFIKNNSFRENLILSRKIFWILAFVFFFKHGLEYFAIEYIYQVQYHSDISYFQYVYENMLVRPDALSWMVAWVMMFLLWITSNKFSIKILTWKWWKTIQTLVYPWFLLSVIHVAIASRFDNFYLFLFVLVVFVRTFSYFSNKNTSENKNISEKNRITTKYLCIPCGYIYDESIWDPDSWISPWTRFEDIPNDWVCPVCWVSKADFEPYYDREETVFGWYLWEVVNYNMLTEDVLEIWLKINSKIEVKKWQYAILLLKDFDSEFSRAYSIVDYSNNILTFWIKVKDIWRGWRLLKSTKIWDIIKIKWIYWDFILQDTTNPKVFIATWTWLSPIINMLSFPLKSDNNYLFFWVQTKSDLFYMDKINNIKWVQTNVYLSREEVEWYNFWRMDLSKFEFEKNSEFYICWNPALVNSSKEYLENAGYKNVYLEKFN